MITADVSRDLVRHLPVACTDPGSTSGRRLRLTITVQSTQWTRPIYSFKLAIVLSRSQYEVRKSKHSFMASVNSLTVISYCVGLLGAQRCLALAVHLYHESNTVGGHDVS